MAKILLSTGGTGGHIFPIYSLYTKLKKMKEIEDIKIMTDERAKNFLSVDDIMIIRSDSPFRKRGIIHINKNFFIYFYFYFKMHFFF